MSSDLAILIFSSTVNIFICLLVLYRNYRKPANIAFAMTGFSLVCWTALNFLSTYLPANFTLTVTRFTGLCGVLLIFSFYALSTVFPNSLLPQKRIKILLFIATCIVGCLSLTPLLIESGVKTANGLELTEGTVYPLYTLYILTMLVSYNINFIRQYRRSQKVAKKQIKLMVLGVSMTAVLITISNVVLPAITDSWSSSRYGTIFSIPFVAITAYAILARRMFDIRLIITRAIAYTITMAILATLYAAFVIFIAAQLTPFEQLHTPQLIALVIPALFIALTFQSIQQVVDRLTKRIFYRDAYDLRDVLDRLSDALLTENDITIMMQQSLDILFEALKPTGAYLAVLNTSGVVYKQTQIGEQTATDLAPFLLRIRRESEALIDVNDPTNQTIAKLMSEHNTELLLRLGSKETPIGLLLLGEKRSGRMYTDQDHSLLRISAKNLGVALDNAKKYEQIANFADTLHKEVKRATSRLRKVNEELKTLDALKDDFIATASHQLRTPSVSVHDALHMLNYPGVTKADRDELLILAEVSSERLVTVVRTMLNMARIQAGHFTIDKSKANLADLIASELEQVAVMAKQKSIKLNFAKPGQPIVAMVDVAKINEAVANYIENAVKYSLEHTSITISLQQQDDRIVFEVADQGMGVPPQERTKLFGRFYRASNARTEQPDGNGIGLYVVKNIAEGHGGDAYFRPGEERGSVFGLWIPASYVASKK